MIVYHVIKRLNWEVAVLSRSLVLPAEEGSFVPKKTRNGDRDVGAQHATGMGMTVCVLL
jgi:hypothetical protein